MKDIEWFPWGCEGATWLDRDGYPYYHEESHDAPMLHSDNFHVVEGCAEAGAESPPGAGNAGVPLNAQPGTLRVGSREENRASAKQAIVERLPEHLRCMLPVGGDELTLTTSGWNKRPSILS